MVTLTALAECMKLGQFPEWSPNLKMRLGDELADTLQRGEPMPTGPSDHPSLPLDPNPDPVRAVLIAFGALDREDDVTDPIDLLRALLPAATTGA